MEISIQIKCGSFEEAKQILEKLIKSEVEKKEIRVSKRAFSFSLREAICDILKNYNITSPQKAMTSKQIAKAILVDRKWGHLAEEYYANMDLSDKQSIIMHLATNIMKVALELKKEGRLEVLREVGAPLRYYLKKMEAKKEEEPPKEAEQKQISQDKDQTQKGILRPRFF